MLKLRQTKEYLDSSKNSILTKDRFNQLLNFIGEELNGDILDVAERNPLTDILEKQYNISIDNTEGDLDVDFSAPNKQYDFIICSHVIEHLFNPLHLLIELSKYLKSNGKIFIAYPQRPQFLWTNLHFHEIDDERFRALTDRAGLVITDKSKQVVHRDWHFYFKGVRPFLRLFMNWQVIYELKKDVNHLTKTTAL